MRKTLSLIVPLFALIACSKSGPLSTKDFQKAMDKLKDHYYSSVRVEYHLSRKITDNEDSYQTEDDRYSNYHYETSNKEWVFDEGDLKLGEAYLPQTLHGADIEGMLDHRYNYEFYINPIKVLMKRDIEDEESKGYRTFEWHYDKYGYLIYILCFDYKESKAENYKAESTYTYNYYYQ